MNKKQKERKCIICGTKFIPKVHNQLCCCRKCSDENARRLNIKKYYENLEKNRERNRKWKLNNKEKVKEYNKIYREENKEYFIKYKKEHRKHEYEVTKTRLKQDLNFKIKIWCRKQIERCLKFNLSAPKKDKRTFNILGYNSLQFKQKIEMQFSSGMTWENHGSVWQIHHKKPLYKFNFVLSDGTLDYQQIRLANSLANLQPLIIEEHKQVHKILT